MELLLMGIFVFAIAAILWAAFGPLPEKRRSTVYPRDLTDKRP